MLYYSMGLGELPSPPGQLIFKCKGHDSFLYTDARNLTAVHVYDRLPGRYVEEYAGLMKLASDKMAGHPIRQTVDGIPIKLERVVPVGAVRYLPELDKWATDSPFVPGPNLSALYGPYVQFMEMCSLLDEQDRSAVSEFWFSFCRNPNISFQLLDMLKTASYMLRRETKYGKIDIIYENVKLGYDKKENIMQLAVTDLSPSIEGLLNAG